MGIVARWLRAVRERDAGWVALRRACRAGVITPALFAVGVHAVGNPTTALFAAFGSISLLLFVDFGGPLRDRATAQGCLVLAGVVLVCLGTLASRSTWSATVLTAVVAFGVLFSGAVSSVLAGAATALLTVLVLSVSLPAPAGSIPDRLAGYGMAGAASVLGVVWLWPAPGREPLRAATARACAMLARRLRAEAGGVACGWNPSARADLAGPAADAAAAARDLRTSFFATPYRPTGLSTEARALVRLVDEVVWLEAILARTPPELPAARVDASVCGVKFASADLLEGTARRLESAVRDPAGYRREAAALAAARAAMEESVTSAPYAPVPASASGDTPGDATDGTTDGTTDATTDGRAGDTGDGTADGPAGAAARRAPGVAGFVSSLEPGFRAQETAGAVSAIAANVDLAGAARERPWWRRALGRRPAGADRAESPLATAQERAGAHARTHSVWFRNSLRGALALGAAVLVAELTGVEHSFWVAFGTLSVLRSSALLTGQNALRALVGTAVGIAVGGGLVAAVGSETTVLWVLLPLALVFSGLAPAAISFAAGQAGFTAVLLILFTIIAPSGWSIGLVRFEDVAIGCAVSLCVGAVFWPRGAGAALSRALSEAVGDSARYLRRAVEFGVSRCDPAAPGTAAPDGERRAAAAAARRLDDAFRGFLAERGTKHLPLADVAALVTAVAVLRQTADAVLALWQPEDGGAAGDRTAARVELLATAARVCGWYQRAARAMGDGGPVPEPPEREEAVQARLTEAVGRDLTGGDGHGTATAIRMVWTADHLDVGWRLEAAVAGPAAAVAERQRRTAARPRLPRRGRPDPVHSG
ncbi:FUSC family protein [Actinacidiphila yeochonensis]|uniref:FUSC family protein n=1 Tax=Actinacidiphila yeochonensis TaxID=89050 RepID=UPI00068F6D0D|nr:FUSC family protein [Actinacidiphila yeochonensis]